MTIPLPIILTAVVVLPALGVMLAGWYSGNRIADLEAENEELRSQIRDMTDRDALGRYVRRAPGEAI